MDFYLVGGAVRDQQLQLPVKDKDWVVVGAHPEELLHQGFKPVGKDFPVFLHPDTGEEYALARTERKKGQGYHGFECHYSTDVTLEEDLKRRDLTINAIAMNQAGDLIDPYGGLTDIDQRKLRHVSEAFSEDPLRVLRVARFAARFHHLGFDIATETFALMQQMSVDGELNYLTPERIWQEVERALGTESPHIFFETLKASGALKVILPEIEQLWGIPNPPEWHPEIDSGLHTMMVLKQAALISENTQIRFAALCHDLGKITTPKTLWPSHPGHEKSGTPVIKQVCQRLRIPKKFQQLAILTSEYHLHCHRVFELKATTIAKLLTQLNAYKHPDVFFNVLLACEADAKGRKGFENRAYPQKDFLMHLFNQTKHIATQPLLDAGYKGEVIGQKIHQQRVAIIKAEKEKWSS